jgi:hypothetical protein
MFLTRLAAALTRPIETAAPADDGAVFAEVLGLVVASVATAALITGWWPARWSGSNFRELFRPGVKGARAWRS